MEANDYPHTKILYIGPLPPPVGGMATVVNETTKALEAFYSVRVLNTVKTTAADRSFLEGVTAQLRLLGQLVSLCLVWRPQIVHIHTCSWFTFWRNAVDVVVARMLGRRVVLHIHGAQFHKFLSALPPSRIGLARAVLRLPHRVIVLGEYWKQLLDQWCEPGRVVVIPNGVTVQPEIDRHLTNEESFTIVCFANYEYRKGQRDLLSAVAALPEKHRVLIALLGVEAESGLQQSLREQAAELGLRVEVPGPVTGDAKDAWWARASCFCLPSYDEGLPLSMLEAMARGVAVVVTRVGAIAEAVADGREGLLFEAGDVPTLTAHLQSLLLDPERTRQIGHEGRERIIRDFSLEQSVSLLRRTYGDLIAGPSR